MKRIGGLFEQIADRKNMETAFWKAARGKRLRSAVRLFASELDDRLNELVDELQCGSFQFADYTEFQVRDTKSRLIHAPAFRDRVVHHAMINILGPVFELGATYHSYACRQNKGMHAALSQARQWTRQGLWFGKVDVTKFYDSIDQERMRTRLANRFQERAVLELFGKLLDSYAVLPGKGLPIGALTSQYLGNFYLDRYDAIMLESGLCKHFLRYMDDSFIWCSKEKMASIRDLARRTLAACGLEIKDGGQWNRCSLGVPFLGFVVYPDRIRLGKQGRQRLRRKYRNANRNFVNGFVCEQEFQSVCTSLFAHAAHADDIVWRRALLYSRRD